MVAGQKPVSGLFFVSGFVNVAESPVALGDWAINLPWLKEYYTKKLGTDCTSYDSAPGLQGRRRYRNIRRARVGYHPAPRALVVWKPPQPRCAVSPSLPLSHLSCSLHILAVTTL